jgi:hypothetical protein
MAYIQREGGERFVIPSYRDVISKRKSQLKSDILDLSAKYGEFMTLHRRGLAQFEVTFSNDPGYLFGESVWFYFKKPLDLIYCEAIPDTTEAYLVIVKDNAVYLDGIFPLENIPEELLVFTTQKGHFDIYLYGDVPLSQEPMEGKFSLDGASVKSFNILETALFPKLPTVKAYQLQLVDIVLRQQGIGVFPTKYVLAVVTMLGLGWMGYSYVTMHKKKIVTIVEMPAPKNPYIEYNRALLTASPSIEMRSVIEALNPFLSLPGWVATDFIYGGGKMTLNVKSLGASTDTLFTWAAANNASVQVGTKGFAMSYNLAALPQRGVPTVIYSLDKVIANLIDRLAIVMPGNVLNVGPYQIKDAFKETTVTINLSEVSPETVILLADQLKELPLVLTNITVKINHGLTGTIVLQALGN